MQTDNRITDPPKTQTVEGLARTCAADGIPWQTAYSEIRRAARAWEFKWPAEVIKAAIFDAYRPRRPEPTQEPADAPARKLPAAPPADEPLDDDGLARGLSRTVYLVRWNRTAGCVEVSRDGGLTWQELSPRSRERELMMVAVSKVARHRGEPWRIKSPAYEWRLIVAVASRTEVAGDGSDVYESVRAWATDLRGLAYRTLGQVLDAANTETADKVLQRFEVGARAGRREKADARRALLACGWRYTTHRGAKHWLAPAGRTNVVRRTLRLLSGARVLPG